MTLAVAAVLAATAAAVTVTMALHRDGPAADGVRVADATGRLTLRVPDAFGRQLRGLRRWDPRAPRAAVRAPARSGGGRRPVPLVRPEGRRGRGVRRGRRGR
ncbi:hypothetical protein LT493_15105 [Streptomyces tricolor]|nr:hypothetical protein [Streptomyces tricolor]